ncbi:hypothetical protein C7974DRAFT_437228 [Boeremia exigua]|uniref:uncharacterized protein n=1 Tax=Boeremia exigua TaxID=749465 RepID=UPI001E8D8361|nr:uncharacterized protein C7974DRAFT_437228 [Boeremia exigua]KAH6613841.1 hypothetical protein C7974DRAFT_437228 [Boeremia exigua]
MASDQLLLDLSQYEKLDSLQVGHLRHFYNLAHQLDGEWYLMGSPEPAQEFLDAYRYQLATMAYASAVTYYHRTPALRSAFKPLVRQLIHKMLLRGCWGYWFSTSHSGKFVDPSITELRKPWADPVVRENIMYSGHLLLMTSLYAMLFDDDEFEKPGSLVFDWNPLFWGEPQKFTYDNRSLQKAILVEMERNKWVGVCCEPNCVFVVCNQFPLIAMRYNDVRDGTNTVDGVIRQYKAAWEEKGMILDDGLFPDWLMIKQDQIVPAKDLGFTAWAGAFMSAWNAELVQSLYPRQSSGFLTNIDGQVRLHPALIASVYRKVATSDAATTANGTSSDKRILSVAVTEAQAALADPQRPVDVMPYLTPTFGYVVKWLSELGKQEELKGLLEYADEMLKPTWEHGGLYYPRNDTPFDQDLRWLRMDRFTGNAAIAYARLNIAGGQNKMWENPWGREYHRTQPWVDGIDLGNVAVLRGVWDTQTKSLVVTVQGWDFENAPLKVTLSPVAMNLPAGRYALYIRGLLASELNICTSGSFQARTEVIKKGEEVDFIFQLLREDY